MPYFSNLSYRIEGKGLAVRSIETIALVAAALLAIIVASRASADQVTRWNQIATDATTTANTDPLMESRIYAILHVAIHDAVNAVETHYEPYLPRTSPAPDASVEAAIAGAAYETLIALLPDSKVSCDEAKEETLRTVSDDSRKAAGLQVGRAAAVAILKARENDGASQTVQYTHTIEGAAAARVMARFFNTDFISFSMTSGAPYPGITRKFWSFSEAARENGASRVLCGIHFSTAVNAGYIQGERIGEWAFEHALRPANPPAVTASSVSEKEEAAAK